MDMVYLWCEVCRLNILYADKSRKLSHHIVIVDRPLLIAYLKKM